MCAVKTLPSVRKPVRSTMPAMTLRSVTSHASFVFGSRPASQPNACGLSHEPRGSKELAVVTSLHVFLCVALTVM
jgi:hypothetical protein